MSEPIMSKNENEELSGGKDGKQAGFRPQHRDNREAVRPRGVYVNNYLRCPIIPVLSKQRLPRCNKSKTAAWRHRSTPFLFCIVYGSGIWSAHLQRDVNQISDALNSDRNLHMIRTFELWTRRQSDIQCLEFRYRLQYCLLYTSPSPRD